jgi:hypothetical protein
MRLVVRNFLPPLLLLLVGVSVARLLALRLSLRGKLRLPLIRRSGFVLL